MSFTRDFQYLESRSITSRYQTNDIDSILTSTPALNENDFEILFKYLVYTSSDEKINDLDRLLQYAKKREFTTFRGLRFLAEPWFIDHDGRILSPREYYSAIEMMAMLEDQVDTMKLFTAYIKTAKAEDPSLSFVDNLLTIMRYTKDIALIQPLLDCHRPEELNATLSPRNGTVPNTILMAAILYGHTVETIERLLDAGCDPLHRSQCHMDGTQSTIINVLIHIEQYSEAEKKQIIAALQRAAVAQNKKNPLLLFDQDMTPLMHVANIKFLKGVELLLGFPAVVEAINQTSPSSKSCALAEAVILNVDAILEREEQSKAIIQLLLAHGACANIPNKKGINPLMIAAHSGPTLSVFDFLLDRLKETLPPQNFFTLLNQSDENGLTVLHFLLQHKKTDQIKAMLEKVLAYSENSSTVFSSLTKRRLTILDYAHHLKKGNPPSEAYDEILSFLEQHTPPNEMQLKLIKLKNACHLLGFSSQSTDKRDLGIPEHEKVTVKAEGFEDKYTFPLLNAALTDFIEQYGELYPDFQAIKEAFDLTQTACHPDTTTLDSDLLFEQYLNNKMIVIPSGWHAHSITLALYQNTLIVSNRGDDRHSDGGVTAFPLKKEVVAQFKQSDATAGKALFSQWINSFSSQSISSEQIDNNVDPEASCILRSADLTEDLSFTLEEALFNEDIKTGRRLPKDYPLLVQEWTDYQVVMGATLPGPQFRTRNSCFLTPDAFYQINDQGDARQININNFEQFTTRLKAELSIDTPTHRLLVIYRRSLTNKAFFAFKQLIETEGGNLEDSPEHPLRRKKISFYYKNAQQGNALIEVIEDRYPHGGISYETGKAFVKGMLSEPESQKFQNALLIKHKPPIVAFPSKSQRHETCSFVNKKSLIEAMLYFLLLNTGAPNAEVLCKARRQYKHFTETMRDNYVGRLLTELINPSERIVNLLILGKLLNAYTPMKPTRIKRQFHIVNHILELYEETKDPAYLEFIQKRINPFKSACTRIQGQENPTDMNQKKLALIRGSCILLMELHLLKDTIMDALFNLDVSQIENFNQVLAYLTQNGMVNETMVLSLATLTHTLENCTKLLHFKNTFSTCENQRKHGTEYTHALDSFVKKSITIIMDPQSDPATQYEKLKKEAQESFTHPQWGKRLFLDACTILLTLGGIVIYSLCKYDSYLLFSQKTKRECAADTLLQEFNNTTLAI